MHSIKYDSENDKPDILISDSIVFKRQFMKYDIKYLLSQM
jgi:hypothetical protein